MKLADLDPDAEGTPYSEWKAAKLNRLFDQKGRAAGYGDFSRISAYAVRDGLAKYARPSTPVDISSTRVAGGVARGVAGDAWRP